MLFRGGHYQRVAFDGAGTVNCDFGAGLVHQIKIFEKYYFVVRNNEKLIVCIFCAVYH